MSRQVTTIFLVIVNILVFFKVLSVTSFFSSSRYQPDFDNYYRTVTDIRHGINPYSVSYMQNLGPPLVFLYFFPFSLFSLHTAQTLNLLINFVSGYLACFILAIKLFPKHKQILTLTLTLTLYLSFLSRYSLQIGQPMLLITLLVALIITNRKFRRIFLTALFTIKAFFILPLIITSPSLRLREGWGELLKNFSGIILILLFSILIVRPSWYLTYLNRIPSLKFTQITEPLTDNEYYNQSLRSTMKRLNLSPLFPYVYLALILFSVILILTTHNPELAILLSFVISPVLWQHYFIALFPIFVKTLSNWKKLSFLTLTFTLTGLILWFPDLRLHEAPVTILNRLLASHFFFSLVLLTLAQIISLGYNSNTRSGRIVQW